MSAAFCALLDVGGLFCSPREETKKGRRHSFSIFFTSKIAPRRRSAHNAPHGPAHRAPPTAPPAPCGTTPHYSQAIISHFIPPAHRQPACRLGSLLAGAIRRLTQPGV
eukprot:325546-Prymnesium_polylepis.1